MFQYLENLRKRPEKERRKAVLYISLGVTIIILIIWAATLSFRIDNTDFSLAGKPAKKDTPSLRETFSGFIEQVGNIIQGNTTN